MPLPPLSPDERRLGTFSLASAALYAASGLFFAVLPSLTLRLAASGQPLEFGPGARLWHTLSISMMAMLALCCFLAGRSPRENRRFLVPVLLSKAVSSGMAALSLLTLAAGSADANAGRRSLLATIGTDFPLLLVTAWFFWKAAPGVSASSPLAARAEPIEGGQKPVALGIARAARPAEVAIADEPAPAAAANAKPPG